MNSGFEIQEGWRCFCVVEHWCTIKHVFCDPSRLLVGKGCGGGGLLQLGAFSLLNSSVALSMNEAPPVSFLWPF